MLIDKYQTLMSKAVHSPVVLQSGFHSAMLDLSQAAGWR